jgi:hypothetical protein
VRVDPALRFWDSQMGQALVRIRTAQLSRSPNPGMPILN